MRSTIAVAVLSVAVLVLPREAAAQTTLHVTPMLGGHLMASSVQGFRQVAEDDWETGETALTLGLSAEWAFLRGSLAYVSDARLTRGGVEDQEGLADGSLVMAAADLVIRPLPRLLVQPYLLAGLGLKRTDFSFERDGAGNPFDDPGSDTSTAFHFGLGADVMFGRLGVAVEVSDYLSEGGAGAFSDHDAVATVGLRVRVL